ncbi:hypothetical protein NDN08_003867 [Rhodosorus marinus]|uniref:Guided entry of tail-anchored proteins factor 1 n=1 Tax=Rhodosorus marinus TaxID=101924 RepID=A0AAV8UM04_9RHOD|nr:hypothetical protein NDN08_003867 [Rhodosorus marinus]
MARMEMILLGCIGVYGSGIAAELVRRKRSGERLFGVHGEHDAQIEEWTKKKEELKVEMEKVNSPSTFVQYAKLQRQAQKYENDIEELKSAESKRKKTTKSKILHWTTRLMLLMYIAVFMTAKKTAMDFDCSLVYPLGKLPLVFRGSSDYICGLSEYSWLVLCGGVLNYITTICFDL